MHFMGGGGCSPISGNYPEVEKFSDMVTAMGGSLSCELSSLAERRIASKLKRGKRSSQN